MKLKTLFLVFLVFMATATCTVFVASTRSTSQKPAENVSLFQCCPTTQAPAIGIKPLGDPIETPGMPG